MLVGNQQATLHNVVFTILVLRLNLSCSMYCGTNILMLKEDFRYNVSAGSDLHLQCLLEFSKKVTFTFKQNATVKTSELIGPSEKYDYRSKNQSGEVLHVLTVKNVDRGDQGRYFCAEEPFEQIPKQVNLTVQRMTEQIKPCKIAVNGVSLNNGSGKPFNQFNCPTQGLSNAHVSLHFNGQWVDMQSSRSTRKAGNNSETTLFLSSGLTYQSNHTFFHCNSADVFYPPCIHEVLCNISSSTVSSNDETSASSTLSTPYQQNRTTILNETTQTGSPKRNKIMIAVGSFLVISLILILSGAELIHQKVLGENSNNKKDNNQVTQLNNVVEDQIECMELATRSMNCNITQTRDRSAGNEACLKGTVMVKNAIYDSCEVDLLTGVPMVTNYIYESAEGAKTDEVESQMYSAIQRI